MEGWAREKEGGVPKGEERIGYVRMTPHTLPYSPLWENPEVPSWLPFPEEGKLHPHPARKQRSGSGWGPASVQPEF